MIADWGTGVRWWGWVPGIVATAVFWALVIWAVVVLAPDRGLERLLPGAPSRALRVRNGGLACLLLLYGS